LNISQICTDFAEDREEDKPGSTIHNHGDLALGEYFSGLWKSRFGVVDLGLSNTNLTGFTKLRIEFSGLEGTL
jgi:hypothetical protein